MPQQPLTEPAIQNYILLEKTQRNLAQKVTRMQNALITLEQRGEKAMAEKLARELTLLQLQLQEKTSELSTYTIAIDHDISVIAQDHCHKNYHLFTLQQLKAEISRLRHRCSSLLIFASREEDTMGNLVSRLMTMTQGIRQLQTRIPELEIEMKTFLSLTKPSTVTTMFKPEENRDLRSSAEMRATLRHL